MTPAPATTAWAIKAPDDVIWLSTIRKDRNQVITAMADLIVDDGYRCVRVQVQEVDEG